MWILILILMFQGAYSQCCDNGWVPFDGHCYLFMDDTKMNWNESVRYCANFTSSQYTSYLVKIETASEDKFLRDFAKRLFRNLGDRYRIWFWVDGDDIQKEGIWIWDENHSLVNYTNWGPGEPSSIWGPEDCMVLWGPFNFAWGDYLCYLKSHFICEKSQNSPTTSASTSTTTTTTTKPVRTALPQNRFVECQAPSLNTQASVNVALHST